MDDRLGSYGLARRFSYKIRLVFCLLVLVGTICANPLPVIQTQDEKRVVAQRSLDEARMLQEQGTAESLRRAVGKYHESLQLWRSVGASQSEAATLTSLGRVYFLLDEREKSLAAYQQSLPVWQAVNDRSTLADTHAIIGTIYSSLGKRQDAIESFKQALTIRQTIGDRGGEASALNNIGAIQASTGELPKAIESFNQSLPLLRQVKDQRGEAQTLLNVAAVSDSLGEKKKAIEAIEQALKLHKELRDKKAEAQTMVSLGALSFKYGDHGKALRCQEEARSLLRALGDRVNEALVLSNIGAIKGKGIGLWRLSVAMYTARLPRLTGVARANALIQMGVANSWLGEYQKALDNNRQAMKIYREQGDRALESVTLLNIGFVYDTLGESQGALEYFEKGLSLSRAAKHHFGEALLLMANGRAYFNQQNYGKALEFFDKALSVGNSYGYVEAKGLAYGGFGLVHEKLGDHPQALEHFDRAAKLLRNATTPRAHLFEGVVLTRASVLQAAFGDREKALDGLSKALAITVSQGERNGEANILYEMARVIRDKGDLEGARALIECALNTVESLRARMPHNDLRSSFYSTVHHYYDFYVDLLMRMHELTPKRGLNGAALQASERARARGLIDLLSEIGANIRKDVKPELLERERALQQTINSKAQYQLNEISDTSLSDNPLSMDKEIASLILQLQEVQEQIRSESPRYAALIQPKPLTITQIQEQVLDNDTLMLEYSLGEERSFLWAVTSTTVASYELPKASAIEEMARRVYELLTFPQRNVRGETEQQRSMRQGRDLAQLSTSARELSRVLLGPVAHQLDKTRIVVVADGALHYLPFGALPDPTRMNEKTESTQPLVVAHEIVNLPSASALVTLRGELSNRKPAPRAVAVIADPVFMRDDQRVRSSQAPAVAGDEYDKEEISLRDIANQKVLRSFAGQSGVDGGEARISRLPYTREEAERILSLVPANGGMKALDFAASRKLLESDVLREYRILHFATHGLADSERPELSTIVLSLVDEDGKKQDGLFRAHEVYMLNLPAELVVLSACETGLGKLTKGEGLVSLTRGFMYAGAARVIVSLWSVSDRATAELMTKFYRHMLVDGQRPAAALRSAQVEMWRENRWVTPYYWAAFTLQGEWR